MMKSLKYCLPQLYCLWWWASEAETCNRWCVKTLWSWRTVCICWSTLW